MDTISAFLHFSAQILEGREGIFFSERDTEAQENWIFGVGEKVAADFEKGPFPFFSVSDFDGKNRKYWHFEEIFSSMNNDQLTMINEGNFKNLKLRIKEDLEKYSTETKESFYEKVRAVQKAEKEGEMWVLNLAHELRGDFDTIAGAMTSSRLPVQMVLGAFLRFLQSGRPHAGGIVWTKDLKFVSFSPEVFLRQKGQKISTYPIKGTGGKKALESEKEISELHMITDLLRNDLAQIARNVKVEKARFLTDEGHFFHARSEISAELINQTLTESDFLKLLPAGSISGSPKHRVVEEILQQESFDRGLYTGTFGVKFSPADSIFNILIRTMFLDDKGWRFPVGAGITVESDPEREWAETLEKAKSVLQFF